jgi:molybdopterin/thiamine biosynthesis adenylyltransferase
MAIDFDYQNAFSRNFGWVSKAEQDKIKNTRVAIGGLGGAGGEHAVTLARMGFSKFSISDLDEFEQHNMNRQAGCYVSNIGKNKCKAMRDIILDINPQADVRIFPGGVKAENITAFLEDVDIYVDGIDFFCMAARELIYAHVHAKKIPNLLAAPLGMGAGLVTFLPGKMNYDEYYNFSKCKNEQEKFLNLLIGLGPSLVHKSYLVVPEAANFAEKRGPSTPMAIKLCSGMLVSNVVKIIIGRGEVIHAPRVQQFDAYKNKLKITHSPFGTRGPINRAKLFIAKKLVGS